MFLKCFKKLCEPQLSVHTVARDGKKPFFIFQFYTKREFREVLFVLDILKKGHASITIDKFLVILMASRIDSVSLNILTGFSQSFNPGHNSSEIRFS